MSHIHANAQSHIQKRTIEGVITVAGATPKRAIAIPLLPKDGAWSITGHVIAVDEATPRHSVTYYPRFRGTCDAGVVTQSATTKRTATAAGVTPNSATKSEGQPTASGVGAPPNNTTKSALQPAVQPTDSAAQPWEPGGLSLTITGQQLEIEVTGIEGTTIVWGWSLDVVVVSLESARTHVVVALQDSARTQA